jgi:hypothetical protein
METKYFNVLTRREFEEDGQTRRMYFRAGVIKESKAGSYLRLFHQPDTTFLVLPQDENATPEIQIEE